MYTGGGDWLPPDLERLRTLETALSLLLSQVQRPISETEAAERVRAGAVRHHPPIVEWMIQYGISAKRRPEYVHTGDCRMVSGRSKPATKAQAMETLQNTAARACEICRADSALGLLDL